MRMRHILRIHTISFKNAFEGLFWALSSQPNYKIHLLSSLIAVVAGWILTISYIEWLILFVLIIMGLVIETINTTIEVTADAIDTNWRQDIKIIKDVAAASMLIFSIGAVFIAGFIFIPKIINLFSS